jgi:hypothetical protein
VAAAVGAIALLGGPAASLALDIGDTASKLAGSSGSEQTEPAAPATTDTKVATSVRAVVRKATTPSTRAEAAPAPVSATVQGSNPHGQGTALAIALGGNEAVVVGRSRGEQKSDGSYHGHTTTLALFGNDVIANDTGPGQTAKGPLAPLQEQLLDQVCKGSSGNLCLDVLRADSSTTANGSTNHSKLVGLVLGGPNGAVATVGDSNGNIEGNGECQKAHGDVTLVKLMLGGNPLLDLGESASDSNACPSGTTVTNSSNPLVSIGGQQIPLPGCGANSPGYLIDLSPLLNIACNAGAATGAGGIVNDALAGTILPGANGPAGTLSGAGTGAAATPPAQNVLGVRQSGGSPTGTQAPSNSNGGDTGKKKNAGGNGSKAPASAKASQPLSKEKADKLPYTGSDVVLALFIASCLLAAGLGLRQRLEVPGGHR